MRAPLPVASATWSLIVSSCGGKVIAPTSTVPKPSGLPTRSARTFSVTFVTNSSKTGSSTYTRSIEMHVWPAFCIE